jgi:hypothetical protein
LYEPEPPVELESAVLELSALVSVELSELLSEPPHAARLAHIAPASNIANNLFFMWKTSLLFVFGRTAPNPLAFDKQRHHPCSKCTPAKTPDSPLIQ